MNLSAIKADINFFCGSTSATYPDVDKVRNVNIHYQDVARQIWEAADGWQYDDSNATSLAIAKATVVHNQQDYTLPSTAQRLHKITIKDSTGTEQALRVVDWADMGAPSQFQATPGLPMYYDLVGRSIMLYPTPTSASVTLVSGLGVYMERDITDLPVTGVTAVPGFAPNFHRILSLGASIDFIQDPQQLRSLQFQKDRLEKGMVRFYSKRAVEARTAIKPATKKRWRQYT